MNTLQKLEKYREQEDNIIKDARNLFRPKTEIIKETEDYIVQNKRNLFK